jgi:hypothetical protein
MITKAIHLRKKDEYFEFDKYLLKDKLIYFLNGARGSGKSYSVKHYIKKMIIQDETFQFGYVRESSKELGTVVSWLNEVDFTGIITGAITQKIERGKPVAGAISLRLYDSQGNLIYDRVIGHCYSLETSALSKSGFYGNIKILVFEEYIRNNQSPLRSEAVLFNYIELIETTLRDRNALVVFIGNSINNFSIIEHTFSKSDNAIKYKIFKKTKKEGVLSNIKDDLLDYLGGELLNDNKGVDLREFIPFMGIKINDNNQFTFLAHKLRKNVYAIIADNIRIEGIRRVDFLNFAQNILYSKNHMLLYADNKTEKLFIENSKEILYEVRDRIYR